MPRPFTPHVVTANALLEGDVVYLTGDDTWSRHIAEAEVIEDEAHAQIRLLDAQAMAGQVVDAYLAAVTPNEDGPRPTRFREAVRTRGPSNYRHGKQALTPPRTRSGATDPVGQTPRPAQEGTTDVSL